MTTMDHVPSDSDASSELMSAFANQLFAHDSRLLAYIKARFPARLAPLSQPEDVLQDTYFEAVRWRRSFASADGGQAFALLATIARHRIGQLLRMYGTTKRGGKSRRAAQGDSIVASLAELAVHRHTPSRSAAGHEFRVALEGALERLPADLRSAVTARYIDGLNPSEIAARMGRTEHAARQLCYRGIQFVRRDLRSASMFM